LTDPDLSLAELLAALSLATDAANGFPQEKALRTCLLAVRVAGAMGADHPTLRQVYYAALLRYLGCVGFAHEEAAHYGGGDDIALRHAMAEADPGRPAHTARVIMAGVGRGTGPRRRALAVATMLANPDAAARHARAQGEAGARLAELLAMPAGVVAAMGQVCERWDGRGGPGGLDGEAVGPVARVVHVADVAETANHRHGAAAAVAEVRARRGRHLAPAVADAFLADPAGHLAGLDGRSVWDEAVDAEPGPPERVSPARLDRVALGFARCVDLKSVWTLGHSEGVAGLAGAAAAQAGLGRDRAAEVRVAALLHDLGRLSVPNAVWDKPGPLNRAERGRVESHSYVGERVLAQSPALRPLAAVAGAHHERLDGGGYHRGALAASLGFPQRLLAVADRFHAMAEPRAHRPALATGPAVAALHAAVRSGELDGAAVDAVVAAAGAAAPAAPHANPAGLTDREVEVLRLVARGGSNKDVARRLGISARTVQHHVAHVYGKLGCSSRAGAALAALEAGVLGPGAPCQ